MPNIKAVRQRAWHYLSPQVASAADMTFQQMQSFIAGNFTPDEKQLRDLALRMGMERPR